MSRDKLIKELKHKNPKLNNSEIIKIIDTFCISVQNALINGKKVEIREFGSFLIKKIKAKYSARNPRTGELIYVPEKNKVRFKASKNLKKYIND